MSTEKHNYNGLLVDIATVFIASCALVLSLVEGCQSRKHNRLMVTPKLSIGMNLVSDQEGRGLFLVNKGIGPAIIKNLEIFVDGVPIKTENAYWNDILNRLALTGPKFSELICNYIVKDQYVSPGERKEFLVVQNGNLSTEDYKNFLKALWRIDVHISYKSVYGEQFEFVLKKEDMINKVLEKMCN